jgi:MFS family permease
LIVLAPVAGRLADRVDSRAVLTGVGLLQAGCCAVMAFVTDPVALIGLAGLLSAGLAITSPTLAALVPDMVSRDHLPRAVAIGQTSTALGMLAGPALAGVLVGAYGLRVPLLIDAATYLAIVVAGLALRTRRNAARPPAGTRAEPPVAWRLRADRLLAVLVPATAVVVGAVSLINVVVVFFVRETLGASPTAYGLLEALWTAAMLAGTWLVSRRAGSDAALAVGLVGALGVTCLVIFGAAWVPSVGWLAALYVIGGLCNGGENTIANLLIARRVPAPARGRAMSTLIAAVNAAAIIGYTLAGPLLGWFTPAQLLAGSGIAGLVVVAAVCVPVSRAAARDRAKAAAAVHHAPAAVEAPAGQPA